MRLISFLGDFYLSRSSVIDSTAVRMGGGAVGAITAGGTSSRSTSVTIPTGTTTGTYYIIAAADDGNAVAETYEDNKHLLQIYNDRAIKSSSAIKNIQSTNYSRRTHAGSRLPGW